MCNNCRCQRSKLLIQCKGVYVQTSTGLLIKTARDVGSRGSPLFIVEVETRNTLCGVDEMNYEMTYFNLK